MTTIEVDIHGMATADAKQKLERLLAALPDNIEEVNIIHGYNQGNALQNMIRKSLKSKKIKQKILSLILICNTKYRNMFCIVR